MDSKSIDRAMWGHVLDYIGVEWREPWWQFAQINLFQEVCGKE